MTTFDPLPYLGLPWRRGAQGPDEWDCWAFARHVLAEGFGIHVPLIPPAVGRLAITRQFRDHAERGRWQAVPGGVGDARPGDLVLMAPGTGRIEHVGVWLANDGGGVVHASEGAGVAFHRPSGLTAAGWQVMEVQRYARK